MYPDVLMKKIETVVVQFILKEILEKYKIKSTGKLYTTA